MELVVLGLIVGFASGFFGIGGGSVLVPLMVALGYDVKVAIGISVLQMLFSSLFGSFLNFKDKMLFFKNGLFLGLGGFCGALSSGYIVNFLSGKTLLCILGMVLFISILKFFKSPLNQTKSQNESKLLLFAVGLFVGALAISVGVGGAIFLTPILVGFLNYDIKKALSISLLFVVFSSLSGIISLSQYGFVDFKLGLIIGTSSLVGVYFGIKKSHIIAKNKQKNYLLILYVTMLAIIIKKIFIG